MSFEPLIFIQVELLQRQLFHIRERNCSTSAINTLCFVATSIGVADLHRHLEISSLMKADQLSDGRLFLLLFASSIFFEMWFHVGTEIGVAWLDTDWSSPISHSSLNFHPPTPPHGRLSAWLSTIDRRGLGIDNRPFIFMSSLPRRHHHRREQQPQTSIAIAFFRAVVL